MHHKEALKKLLRIAQIASILSPSCFTAHLSLAGQAIKENHTGGLEMKYASVYNIFQSQAFLKLCSIQNWEFATGISY